jgi:hypothetical protein
VDKDQRAVVGPVLLIVLGGIAFAAAVVLGVVIPQIIDGGRASEQQVQQFLDQPLPEPFVNPAADAQPPQRQGPDWQGSVASFQAPEGFSIVSYSNAWTADKLAALRDELLANRHGSELENLESIVIMAGGQNNGDGGTTLGSHQGAIEQQNLNFNFPAFPSNVGFSFAWPASIITLTGGDDMTTVQSMAYTLSHEYGHLYTRFHMFGDAEDLADTKYAQLRQAKANDLITAASYVSGYTAADHYRYLIEIAADDYVQLMGSPTTRQVMDFPDVQDTVNGANQPSGQVRLATNAFPQENLTIPLASEVAGLGDYFYSFVDEPTPLPAQPRAGMRLSITPDSVSYDTTTGPRTYTHFNVTWNTPYRGATYTLLAYDPARFSGSVRPIKTVEAGQPGSAVIGTVTKVTGNRIEARSDGIDSGTKTFLVIALLPDGTLYSSEPLTRTF